MEVETGDSKTVGGLRDAILNAALLGKETSENRNQENGELQEIATKLEVDDVNKDEAAKNYVIKEETAKNHVINKDTANNDIIKEETANNYVFEDIYLSDDLIKKKIEEDIVQQISNQSAEDKIDASTEVGKHEIAEISEEKEVSAEHKLKGLMEAVLEYNLKKEKPPEELEEKERGLEAVPESGSVVEGKISSAHLKPPSTAPIVEEVKLPLKAEELKAVYAKLKSFIEWNEVEELYESRYLCWCGRPLDMNYVPRNPATAALLEKLRVSFVGCFLQEFNSAQLKDEDSYADKLQLSQFMYRQHEDPRQDRNNDVTKDVLDVIQKAVTRRKIISAEVVQDCMWSARLTDCLVTEVDSKMKKLNKLQMLSLPANWISDIKGSFLPRHLRFLELYCNLLSDLSNICHDLPNRLCHLGLARNRLNDGSHLNFLALAVNLRTLDMGDNDICELVPLLRTLSTLDHLVGLALHGNPCSTCKTYRETTLKYLPRLIYLDNLELWAMDREELQDCVVEDFAREGALVFKCFRLMGIPQPAQQTMNKQKVVHTYHIEIELPLLDSTLREAGHSLEPADPEADILVTPKDLEDKKGDGDKKKGKKEKGKEGERKGRKKKGKKDAKKEKVKGKDKKAKKVEGVKAEAQVEEEEDEFVESEKEKKRLSKMRFQYLKTECMPWANIIEFPDLDVPALGNDLMALRDTLRSRVNVKVVYLKTLPPEDEKSKQEGKKKEKKDKKDGKKGKDKKIGKDKKKGKDKKGKGDKKGKKKDESDAAGKEGKPEVEPDPVLQKEKILHREMLANFDVQLQQPVWSEITRDYRYSGREAGRRQPNEAKPVPRPLLEIEYEKESKGEKGGKKGKSGGKSKSKDKKSKSESVSHGKRDKSKSRSRDKKLKSEKKSGGQKGLSMVPVPKILTCEMGFGVSRIQDPVPSLPAPEPEPKHKSRDELKKDSKKPSDKSSKSSKK